MHNLLRLSLILGGCISLGSACEVSDIQETSEQYAADCIDSDGDGFGWSETLQDTCNPNRLVTPQNQNVLYLTFDDGPSRDNSTDNILQTLARYNAKATFFVTGEAAARNPAKLRAIHNAGHAIGLHSYSHQSYQNMSLADMRSDMAQTQGAIDNAGTIAVECYRPPFGATSASIRQNAQNLGYAEVLWDVDTSDWMASRSPQDIMGDLDQSQNGDTVLMHDGPTAKFNTVDAFEQWMANNHSRFDFEVHPDCAPSANTPGPAPTTTPGPTINGRPICASASSDPDGDGYGYENNQSCVVSN